MPSHLLGVVVMMFARAEARRRDLEYIANLIGASEGSLYVATSFVEGREHEASGDWIGAEQGYAGAYGVIEQLRGRKFRDGELHPTLAPYIVAHITDSLARVSARIRKEGHDALVDGRSAQAARGIDAARPFYEQAVKYLAVFPADNAELREAKAWLNDHK